MTPLEAALALPTPLEAGESCWYCHRDIVGGVEPHAADCPWRALPSIVRALRAAEAVRVELVGLEGCGLPYRRGGSATPSLYHLYEETVAELVAALKGEAP